jgi:hypothetical protein
MKGLFKKLAFAAPLVVCLPLCAQAGDAAASDDPPAKIFEDYSLTSATQDSGDSPLCRQSAGPGPGSLRLVSLPGAAELLQHVRRTVL